MTELARCPCWKIPHDLGIDAEHDRPKYARACGTCCSEWWIEFRNQYHEINSAESFELAKKAWNEAPRGKFDAAYWMQVAEHGNP